MIVNFMDKLGGFLDKRFIVAYWAPTFLTLGLFSGVHALHAGFGPAARLWKGEETAGRVVATVAVLLAVTVVAHVLQAFTAAVVRFFEGYSWPEWLARWAAAGHRARADRLEKDGKLPGSTAETARFQRYFAYPPTLDYVRPTRLGNVLTSAEHYPQQVYGVNAVLWWPRLHVVLTDGFREQISAALVPMLSMLNLSGGCALAALAGSAYLAVTDERWWAPGLVFAAGLLLARMCYLSAVAQAVAYGNLLRSAFDLHRRDVLKQMGVFAPATVNDEEALWDVLNTWLYEFTPPHWRTGESGLPAWVADPFRYDGGAPASASPSPEDSAQTGAAPSPALSSMRLGEPRRRVDPRRGKPVSTRRFPETLSDAVASPPDGSPPRPAQVRKRIPLGAVAWLMCGLLLIGGTVLNAWLHRTGAPVEPGWRAQVELAPLTTVEGSRVQWDGAGKPDSTMLRRVALRVIPKDSLVQGPMLAPAGVSVKGRHLLAVATDTLLALRSGDSVRLVGSAADGDTAVPIGTAQVVTAGSRDALLALVPELGGLAGHYHKTQRLVILRIP